MRERRVQGRVYEDGRFRLLANGQTFKHLISKAQNVRWSALKPRHKGRVFICFINRAISTGYVCYADVTFDVTFTNEAL